MVLDVHLLQTEIYEINYTAGFTQQKSENTFIVA
jgi:hypothetical protein